jgi:hypothetical protein
MCGEEKEILHIHIHIARYAITTTTKDETKQTVKITKRRDAQIFND